MANPQYNCEVCTAQCTFEAMQMCQGGDCPTEKALMSGVIVDRLPTDFDPRFPSHFRYALSGEVGQ